MIPTPPHLIIRPDTEEQVTSGGIIIPDTAKEKKNTATVVKVAKKVNNYKPMFKEGERIMFNNNQGFKVNMDGEEMLIIQERDVYAGDL